jgi:hypothetical protein
VEPTAEVLEKIDALAGNRGCMDRIDTFRRFAADPFFEDDDSIDPALLAQITEVADLSPSDAVWPSKLYDANGLGAYALAEGEADGIPVPLFSLHDSGREMAGKGFFKKLHDFLDSRQSKAKALAAERRAGVAAEVAGIQADFSPTYEMHLLNETTGKPEVRPTMYR